MENWVSRVTEKEFLTADERQKLESEMAANPEWQELDRELDEMKSMLRATPPKAPNHIWENIRTRLAWPKKSSIPMLSIITTIAASVLLWAFFAQKPEMIDTETEMLLSKANQQMATYEKTLSLLENRVEKKLEEMPPELKAVFESEIEALNETIERTEQLLAYYPTQIHLHRSLAKAYNTKLDLFQTLLEV